MLTYEYQEIFKVKLNGKVVGEIRSEGFGYRYWPKGVRDVKRAGQLMSSVSLVQNSLTCP